MKGTELSDSVTGKEWDILIIWCVFLYDDVSGSEEVGALSLTFTSGWL